MPANDAGNSRRALTLLAAVLAVVMFAFPLTVSYPLLDPDEGLHASIAQEMVERGNWVTPQFLGQPFFDKPIFYFWVQAASLWLLGPSEVAVRLPGLMFGLLSAITTGLLGWRMFGRTTGLIAGILYATTILPTALAQAASHDVALIPWINLALLLLWESDRVATRRSVVLCSFGAGLFVGLAILTKGLFGVAVVGLAYGSYLLIGFYRGKPKRGVLVILLQGLAVLAVAALVASPWYFLIEMRHPGYLRYFFLERHLLGFTTDLQPHGNGPWWYYLPVLLGGGLPWIGYLPIVVQDGLARRRSFRAMPLLWSWLIGWTLLMILAGSQLATYLWPAFPPIAILVATSWARLMDGTLTAAARRSFTRTFVSSSWSGPIVLPAAVLAVQLAFDVQFTWPVWVAVGIAAVVAPLPLIPWHAGRWQASLTAAVLSVALQFVVVMTGILPPVAEKVFSAHALAEHFNRLGHLPPRLLVVEGRLGSLVFYLAPQLRAGLTTDQLQQMPAEKLPPLSPGDMIAVPERKIHNLRGRLDLGRDGYESIGPYRLYGTELRQR